MESMDISYSDEKIGDVSDMICDEEQHECSDHQNIVLQQVSQDAMIIEQDSQHAESIILEQKSDTSKVNILPEPNTSFPAENSKNGCDANRFPLQDTKDCNQLNIMSRSINSMELLKGNLMNTLEYSGICGSDKENMFEEAREIRLNEFPTETKSLRCAFPLDNIPEFVSDCSSDQHSSLPEEHFTPANEYNFTAADFDCLLSRGCSQPTSGTVKSTLASTSSPSTANLPRNSVLDNFDPLLRRQTIIKPENRGSVEHVEGSPSGACLALVNLPQRQPDLGSTIPIPASYNIGDDPSDHQLVDSTLLLLNALDSSSTTPLSQHHPSVSFKDNLRQEETACCLLDATIDPNYYGNRDHSESSLDKTLTTVENEISESSKSSERLVFSTNSITQEVLDSPNEEQNEPLVEISNFDKDSVQLVESNTDAEELSKLDSGLSTTPREDLIVEQLHESHLKVPSPVKQPALGVITEHTVDLSSTVIFAGVSNAHNDLTIHDGNMIAEPNSEKQNIAVQNMSEDRSVPNEEGYAEVEKKSKTEEVNIADIEKKMHDVELREESMLKRITEKDKTISKMSNVVEAYERTIAELISEKEILIRNHEVECESLKQDNEINAQHLESLEKTFSNLYAKYERMKKSAIKYKENEDKLLEKVLKLEECLRAQEQRYEKMKGHAMSQLEIANTKIDEALRNHSQESAKLKAQIKKEELYRISINEQLIQKSKENEELVKICDELISETN
ncbi:transforming acidic coiled-coil-containing protein 1 [Anopheles funestus]|uniref:TACC_C domain-containing protein n=1 Tax=Anopheles funestus TaxID=62324 RepID=A0A182RPK4_ANOFN|nr:transforming acidic coiled-coil-containing protein 1 [Anopheles funestus]